MKSKLRVIAVTILVLSASLWGQSILSLHYPFGLPLRSLSGTALCMGGVSIGVTNDHHVMLSNPGNLGTINTTAFSSLLLVDYLRVKENDLYTDHIHIHPRQISFALPMGVAGTIAFSLVKETNTLFKFRDEEVIFKSSSDSILHKGQVSFDWSGGTTSWQAGWGYKIGKFINVGIAYSRTYLSIDGTELKDFTYSEITPDTASGGDITYDTSDADYIVVRDSSHLVCRGNVIRVGLMGTIKDLSIGIAVDYFFKNHLSYDNALYNEVNEIPISNSVLVDTSIVFQMPPSVAMGLSYAISPKWLVGADLSLDLWKYYTLEIEKFSAETQKKIREDIADIKKDNTVSVSAGFRFIPAPNLLVPKYWETIHYRGGIRYSQLPGKTSSEMSGSMGFGFPLRGNGLLDLGFEIGKRTSENYSNYDETFLHVIIGINGGRKWRKTPEDTY